MNFPGQIDQHPIGVPLSRPVPEQHGRRPDRGRRRSLVAVLTLLGVATATGPAVAGTVSAPVVAAPAAAAPALAAAAPAAPAAAAPAAAAATALKSPFSVVQATIRDARRIPAPTSGSEILLYANSSTATITLTGSGRVVLLLAGNACAGVMPIVAADIDGVRSGTVKVVDQTTYHIAPVGKSVALGTHVVTVRLTNDYADATCDRNAVLSAAYMEFAGAPPVAQTPAATPGTSNTGRPRGTNLAVHQGDLVITKAGTVIDGWDVRGRILVKADNVTVRHSVIRGGAALTVHGALIESWWGFKNLTVTDSTLRASSPSVNVDGISGANYTAARLDVYDVVDQVKVIGSNVTVRDSWLHDSFHSTNDPNQADGKTHDDNVQIEGGSNIVLEGNLLTGAHNAGIMLTQNKSVTSNVRVQGNWISDGACQINVDQKGKAAIQGTSILENRFGPGSYGATCAMRLPKTSPIKVTSNTWLQTGKAATANLY